MKASENIWKTTDELWMSERKSEWRNVVANLNKLTNLVDKKGQKYHRELFFSGRIHEDLLSKDPEVYGRMLDVRVFDSNELFFRMWYHPDPSLEAFREMISLEKNEHGLDACRSLLFVRIAQEKFANEYGLAGGVEELMVKAIILSPNFKEEYEFPNGGKISKGISPRLLSSNFTSTIFYLLRGMKRNPFHPGQYLVDYFDYTLEKYPEILKTDERFRLAEKHLRHALYDIQKFDTSKMEPFQVKAATRLREELLTRFESRDFGATLMGYWDEAKSRYEAGELPPSFT